MDFVFVILIDSFHFWKQEDRQSIIFEDKGQTLRE